MRVNLSIVRLLVLLACATLAAGPVRAGFPTPGCPTVPPHINLVGHALAGIDPRGEFTVVVRDLACNPIAGSIVVVELPPGSDLRVATSPLMPITIVDCPTRTIRTATDGNGIARFRIVGASRAGPPTILGNSVRVYADGFLLATITAGAFDLDGLSGVGGADLAMWLDDFGSAADPTRSDFDGNGFVGGADLAAWLTLYGASGSTLSGTAYCP